MRAANSNGEETEKAIREAAVKVIAKHGFQAASLREIAKEVGIRAPSLYNYIKSKEKLLYDLLKVPVSAMIADYEAKTREVSSADTLHLALAPGGGACVLITGRR